MPSRSPVLFTEYLEACMKEIKTTHTENSYELIYADDVNIVSPSDIKLDEMEAIFCKRGFTLKKWKKHCVEDNENPWKLRRNM